eukprot:COSAG05_NODE_28664_length_119_cov_125.650000_1_plen_20_part_01
MGLPYGLAGGSVCITHVVDL